MRLRNLALTSAVLMGLPSAIVHAASVGSISADYSNYSGDNTTFKFSNTSGYELTNASLSGTGDGTYNTVSGTKSLGTISGSSEVLYSFDNSASAFQMDFDDIYHGQATYTFTADVFDGTTVLGTISASFSPSSNATGGFLGFLGNGSTGTESDASITSTVVANLDFSSPAVSTPLPSTAYAGLGLLGVLGCGMLARRRKVAAQ